LAQPNSNKGAIAMNQFFYEQRGKEKVKGLLEEGQRSQAIYRSGASKAKQVASSVLRLVPATIVIIILLLLNFLG
jgi:hypothetical protein